jgi:hypothetical protein
LLLPDGVVGAPSLSFSSDAAMGFMTAAANNMYFVDGGAFLFQIHAGGVRTVNGSAAAPSYSFTGEQDSGHYWIGANNIGMSVGGALVMDWENTNVAGAGADLVTISSTLAIMDGGPDIVDGLLIDLTNAVHTGGNVYGIRFDDITGAALANEFALEFEQGWDAAMRMSDNLAEYITFTGAYGAFALQSGTEAFLAFPTGDWAAHGGTATQGFAANAVYVMRGYVERRITISRVAFELVVGGAAGAECGVGIYTSGGTLVGAADGISCLVADQGLIDTDIDNFTIGPGFYLFAVTSDDANVTMRAVSTTGATGVHTIMNATSVQAGTATNASANGEFPATTGVVNASTPNAVLMKWQGS